MSVADVIILVLLVLSAACTIFGIKWTAFPVVWADKSGDPGEWNAPAPTTKWERGRGAWALGFGLLLNTAGAVIGVLQSAYPSA